MDGGTGDTVSLGQLAEALSAFAIAQDGRAIQLERLASDVPAFEPGATHTGPHPLDDQVALELGDSSDNEDNGAA